MNTPAPISLGLFGSSHISRYPLHLFHNYNIQPIVISSSPKNIAAIERENTVHQAIQHIQSHNIKLDMILILIGANDIGTLHPQQIIDGIIRIGDTFNNINIQPIIVPILNRKSPRNISQALYKTHRNRINKHLRLHYKNQHIHNIIQTPNLHLEKDGVHLAKHGYNALTKAIAFHIKKRNIPTHITQLPPGHYTNHHTREEIIVTIITETNQS